MLINYSAQFELQHLYIPPLSPDALYKSHMMHGDVNAAIGQTDLAFEFYGKAALVAEGELGEDKWAEAFIVQQSCLHTKGRNHEALTNLLPLLTRSTPLSPYITGLLKRTLGNIYRSTANWHKAENYLTEAIDLAKQCGDIVHEGEWKGDLGQVYRSSGLHQRALTLQKEAYHHALSRGDRARLATACGYIGFTKYSLNQPDHDGAVQYLGARLAISELLGDKNGIGWCLNNIGKVYHSLGKVEPAIHFFQRRLQLAKEMKNELGEGTALGNLGSAYRDAGEYEKAIKCHEQYLKNASKRLDTGGEAIMLRELATDCILLGNFPAALQYALRGMVTNSSIRSRLSNQDDQLKIANHEKNQSRTYSLLQHILTKLHNHHAALLVSEMGRARALTDLVESRSGVKSSFLFDLENITDLEGHLIDSVISRCCNQIVDLASTLSSTIVIYSVVDEPSIVSTSTQRSVYIWVVPQSKEGKRSIHFEKSVLGSRKVELALDEDHLSGLRRDMEKMSRDIKRYKKPAQEMSSVTKLEDLYNMLIAPIEKYLPSSPDCSSQLILIPHGILFNIPFAALKSNGRFLIERFSLSQAPSVAILQKLTHQPQTSQQAEEHTLIVGNPVMPRADISQLTGAEHEARTLHSILGGQLLTTNDATKESVLNELPRCSLVHLATHATLADSIDDLLEDDKQEKDGDYSVKGAIVLSRSSASCSGILTSSEIQKLELSSCELMTLSCCWTACGKVTGDGILGLSRAILIAGARCLVLTHWKIHDSSTPALMEAFYSHYKISRDASAALRMGMLKLIASGEPVAHWAAFCVLGISPGMIRAS